MKKIKSPILKSKNFLLLGIFILIIALTGIYAFTQRAAKPQEVVYVKLKLSQGLWWSSSSNPPIWLAETIKPGDFEKDLFGNEIASVLSKTYYSSEPLKFPNQHEVYLTLKLATKKDSGTGRHRYKRSPLAVGSPLNIDLSSATITGSVMSINTEEPQDTYLTKKIILSKQYAYYEDSPDEFESIKIGDNYFDGQDVAFKITDKYLKARKVAFSDINGRPVINTLDVNQHIYLEAEIKVKEIDNMYFYGEEQRVAPGANLNIITNSQDLSRYTVVSLN